MGNPTAEETEKTKQLISAGSEVLGGAAGAAIGYVVGGPVGAIGGAASGPVLTYSFRRAAAEL
jgi:hypothetical protein